MPSARSVCRVVFGIAETLTLAHRHNHTRGLSDPIIVESCAIGNDAPSARNYASPLIWPNASHGDFGPWGKDDMIWSLQILRFIAALMIVYLHAGDVSGYVTGSNGLIPYPLHTVCRSGVDIFFVISGVIITKIAYDSSPSEFIWSRVRRI